MTDQNPPPEHGQNPPPYGQNPPPSYGENPPAYGQNPPASAGTSSPYGQSPYGQSPYGQSPYGQSPYGQAPAPSDKRPGTVTAACVLTWIFAPLAILLALATFGLVRADRDELIRQIEQDGTFRDTDISADRVADIVQQGALVFLLLVVVLSLLAMVLAVFVIRRSRVARTGLIVLAVIATLISLPLSLAIVPFVWVIACVVTIVLLFAGGASAWFRRA
ncbi:hypothetical protein [Nocardioides donggukensis]|uniref:DUF4064 domain-containing protein n=1 Tax=Nocardioides donggukensis TaxID=2774019 RepID=A0A927Q0A9_9ACTN|nr:hypothetical protein [Nocardioides donggukensis]MBD8868229.1 hypothetical protein [Nocardioides donggukensis]